MNYNQITIGIVTFKSENVIFNCLKSIKKIKNIIIFDNSNDKELKIKIKKKYPKIKFILSKKNLGYGAALKTAINFAKKKSNYIIYIDSDLTNPIKDIKKINNTKRVLFILIYLSFNNKKVDQICIKIDENEMKLNLNER